jgi:5-methylcytosine-specific restriction endonuclease McrA
VKIGGKPLGRQMSDKATGSSFSTGTYEKRFGSWNKASIEFISYVQKRELQKLSENYLDNVGILSKRNVRRTPRDINWRLRAKILIQDNCICRMCGESPAKNPETMLHVDHITAWVNGGETVEENLQTLCARCNIGKSDIL